MDIKFQVDAEATLDAFRASPKTTAEEIRRALLESCRLVQSESRAKHKFRSKTGMLEKAIDYKVDAAKCKGIISIDSAVAPYGHWVHTGTKAHDIFPKSKKSLRWVNKNGFAFAKHVRHPGTKPDEFLYQAAERSRGEINAIFGRHVDEAQRKAGLK
jgi:hypothetical protein